MLRKGFLAAAVVAAATAGIVLLARPTGYEVNVVMPSAVGVVEGTPVQVNGVAAGEVSGVRAVQNKAIATLTLDSDHAPVAAGSEASVEWRSVLGERFIAIKPGPAGNPAMPSGALIPAGSSQVTVENLLEALDPPTRDHLRGLLAGLDRTTAGKQQDLSDTLRTAGPAVDALGSVLDAVGTDGPAIRGLVTNLHKVSQALAGRQSDLGGSVRNLGTLTQGIAGNERQLRDSLREVPATLDTAQATFAKAPDAIGHLKPLLAEARPSTAQLPAVARNLSPLLADLRPTMAQLRPTLDAASTLLRHTPGLLDMGHATVPPARQAIQKVAPAVSFLRPYTPEAMGFLSNFGNIWAPYDSQGHFVHILVTEGAMSLNGRPGVALPGETVNPKIRPGEIGGQPWTDATGSGLR